MNRSRVQLLERACSEDAIQDKGDRRGSQARKRGERQRMGKLLEKARKDNEHQRTDEDRPELDVQSPSRNDERHDRRAKRDHSRDDHREGPQAGMARSRRPPRPPICMRTRPPSREYTNGRQKSGTCGGRGVLGVSPQAQST